LFQFV